jgi:hypothetical protein
MDAGRTTTLFDENMSLGTGNVLAAIRTAAVNSLAAWVEVLRVEIGQSGTTTSAQIRAAFSKRDTAGTLTMTSTTPQTTSPLLGPASGLSGNTAPAGGDGRSGTNSSADSGGTYVNHRAMNFNNLNGYLWVATPRDRIIIPPSTVWCVRLLAAPTTTTGWTINIDLSEL